MRASSNPLRVRAFQAFALGLLLSQGGCGPPVKEGPKGQVVTAQSDGSRVTVAGDELLTVKLGAQTSTGYTWTVQALDSSILQLAGREHESGPLLGGVDTEILRFKGVGAGRARLTLAYRRPWDEPAALAAALAEPPATYSLDVDVEGPYTGTYRAPAAEPLMLAELDDGGSFGAPPEYNACDPGDGSYGRCTPVRNQGGCGSCWAFATAGVLENVLRLADPTRAPDLSEQYLVSCNAHGWSCAGGWDAFAYYVDQYVAPPENSAGAVYETDFPYTATDEPCGSRPHAHHERLTGFTAMDAAPSVSALKDAMLANGPLWVTVCADSAFSYHSGGVFRGSGCSRINHAVVLVGWNDEDGGYWHLRNSWGPGWGVGGYMRIAYGANAVGSYARHVSYTPGNRPPIADAGTEQTVHPGVTVSVDGSRSSDPDGRIARYAWSQTGGPAVALAGGDAARATFVAPAITSDATLTFRLTVTDDDGASASATASITVVRENRPPVADAGPAQAVTEGATVALDGSGSSDPDGSIATWSWTQIGGRGVARARADTARPTLVAPTVPADETLTFRLTVADDSGASASATTTVSIVHANRAPLADAGRDQAVSDGAAVTLDGSGSRDPDGSVASHAWTQIGGPAVALEGAATAHPSFVVPIVNVDTVLRFQLTVRDDAGASATDGVAVTIRHVNVPPLAHAGPETTAYERTTVTLDGSRSLDPDGTIAACAWAQTGGPAVTLGGADTPWATFTVPAVGADAVLRFALRVTDNAGATATATTSVRIARASASPIAHAGPDQSAAEGDVVTLDGSRSFDPGGTIAAYGWVQIGGPEVTLARADTAWPTFVAPHLDADATLTFQLTVAGVGGASASATTTVTVVHLNRSPTADAGADRTVDGGSRVVLDGTASSDHDGSITAHRWIQAGGPAVALEGAATARPSFDAPGTGTDTVLVFQLTVTDEAGASAVDDVRVTVLATAPVRAAEPSGGCASGGNAGLGSLVVALAAWRRRREAERTAGRDASERRGTRRSPQGRRP
jgi:predicted secreted protein